MGKQWKQWQVLFLGGYKITADGDCGHEIKRHLLIGIKAITNLDSILKSRDITLPTKVCLVKAMVFLVVRYGCESWQYIFLSFYKESWVLKNWCFWTVVLEKTLESPLDCKEIQPVHPKGNQSWIFTARTDVEAETLILWPPDAKNWVIWKDPDARKDWRLEKKWTTEDDMVGWHHRLNGHELEKLQELMMDREAWHAAAHGVAESRTQLNDWTKLNLIKETHYPWLCFLFYKAKISHLIDKG